MKFKGILFDLDGVLVHTDKLHYRAWKKIADECGILFNEEINNLLRGVSRMESLEIILRNYHGPALSQKEKEALAEEKNNYYKEELKSMTPDDVTVEVRETLAALKAAGIKIAIGSSSKNTKFILKRVGLDDVFDAVSQKRCYRDAMPLEESFSIIEKGSGSDFDPRLVKIFLAAKEEVKELMEAIERKGEV